jgi:hypothetical protein
MPDGPDGYPEWAWAGFAGWSGMSLLDGLGWPCRMSRTGFAGWGGVVFARWAGLAVPDGLGFFAGQAGLA